MLSASHDDRDSLRNLAAERIAVVVGGHRHRTSTIIVMENNFNIVVAADIPLMPGRNDRYCPDRLPRAVSTKMQEIA